MEANENAAGRVSSRIFFTVLVIIFAGATLVSGLIRFTEPLSISPWEPAIAMESMRLNAGLPVYDADHATHLYGPFLTVLLAVVLRITGLNLLAGRVALSLFSFGLAALLSFLLCRGNRRSYWLVTFLLFLGINFRTNFILFSAQPDAAAAFFGVGALWLWAARPCGLPSRLIAIGLFLVAMLFKQTAAAFALVPFVYGLLWKRRASDLLTAAVPLLSILAALLAIRLIWPQIFAAMVLVPASIKVNYNRIIPMGFYFIATFPIFLLAVIAYVFSENERTEQERWIWAAIMVLVPVSIWTTCKSGGGYSSLLFGYLAMTALVAVKLTSIRGFIDSLPRSRALLGILIVAVTALFSFFIQFNRDLVLLFTTSADRKYEAAINYARQLPGIVISPQDPTIAYQAKRYFGRSLFFELDTHVVNGNWPDSLPQSLERELAHADFVVQAESFVPTPVIKSALISHQFQPLTISDLTESRYTIWAKVRH